MKIVKTRDHAKTVSGIFTGIVFIMLIASNAAGITLPECPPGPCPGSAPYAEVTFFGAVSHDIFVVSPPFVIDQSLSDSAGSGRGIANLAVGTLRADASAAASASQFTTIATGRDLFSLGGLIPGSVVDISAMLAADGFINVTQEGATGGIVVSLGGPAIPSAAAQRVYQGFSSPAGPNQVPLNTQVPISLATTNVFAVTVGVPFDLAYALRLDTKNGTHLDVLSTARLSFTLPPGASISSLAGFVPVPGPAALWLFGSGLVGLFGAMRKRTAAVKFHRCRGDWYGTTR